MKEIQNTTETCPGKSKADVEFFKCPQCGGQVEIWSDENVGACTSCNSEFSRP